MKQGSSRHLTVVPNDATRLAKGICDSIYVGGTGDVTIIDLEGTTVTFKAVPVGTTLRVRAAIIKATLTTATLMIAMYDR